MDDTAPEGMFEALLKGTALRKKNVAYAVFKYTEYLLSDIYMGR